MPFQISELVIRVTGDSPDGAIINKQSPPPAVSECRQGGHTCIPDVTVCRKGGTTCAPPNASKREPSDRNMIRFQAMIAPLLSQPSVANSRIPVLAAA